MLGSAPKGSSSQSLSPSLRALPLRCSGRSATLAGLRARPSPFHGEGASIRCIWPWPCPQRGFRAAEPCAVPIEEIPMETLANPEIWIALATLTALELVLGIDNIIFISILAGKLPPEQRDKARRLGITLAAVTRLGLLLAIAWI